MVRPQLASHMITLLLHRVQCQNDADFEQYLDCIKAIHQSAQACSLTHARRALSINKSSYSSNDNLEWWENAIDMPAARWCKEAERTCASVQQLGASMVAMSNALGMSDDNSKVRKDLLR